MEQIITDMNKQTVGYSESHESFNPATGLKSWKKIWYDKEINEDQDPTEAFKEAKALVDKWGNGNSIMATDGVVTYSTGTPPAQVPIRDIAAERTEILIDKAKTIQDLEWLANVAERYNLQTAYNNKLQSLSKIKTI